MWNDIYRCAVIEVILVFLVVGGLIIWPLSVDKQMKHQEQLASATCMDLSVFSRKNHVRPHRKMSPYKQTAHRHCQGAPVWISQFLYCHLGDIKMYIFCVVRLIDYGIFNHFLSWVLFHYFCSLWGLARYVLSLQHLFDVKIDGLQWQENDILSCYYAARDSSHIWPAELSFVDRFGILPVWDRGRFWPFWPRSSIQEISPTPAATLNHGAIVQSKLQKIWAKKSSNFSLLKHFCMLLMIIFFTYTLISCL